MVSKEPARTPAPAPAADEPQRQRLQPQAAPQRAAPVRPVARVDRSAAFAGTIGNRAMQRLVSQPGDPHERQADHLAGQVAGAVPAPRTAGCGCGEGPPGGRPLDPALRAGFEARFGTDLSAVRLHTGGRAARQARALRAQAFTVGTDIAFGAGHYAPTSTTGRRLIAHELVHVLQQSGRLGAPVPGTVQRQEAAGAQPGTAAAEPAPEFAVTAPEPEEAREDTPAGPRPGARRSEFRGVVLADDREFMRGELRRLVAARGLGGADEWHRMLHGWRPATIGVPFSAHTRHLGPGMRPRSPIDVQREMQREQYLQPLVTLTDEVYAEVRADALAFLASFEQRAKEVTLNVLADSEARTEAERLRYGLTRDVTVTMRRQKESDGGYVTVPQINVRHGMDTTTVSARGLAGAAQDLQAKRAEITRVAMQRDALLERRHYGQGGLVTTLPERNRPQYERLGRVVEEKRSEYDVLRNAYETRYPILAAYADNLRALARLARGPSADAAAVLNEEIVDTLDNIRKVREELQPGGRVKVWKLPDIVALTKSSSGAVPGTTLGAMRSRVVDDKVRQVESEDFWTNIALAALAIGLALVAAIPSGGSSLVAGAAAVAGIASVGLSIHTAAQHVQQYQLERAMAGSDFDRARAVSAEDPSLFWLAVDILGAALDVGPALRGTRVLLTASQQTFRRMAPIVRRALAAPGGAAADELAELRRLAEAAPNGGPGLASRVVTSVEQLRAARGSVERVAGAAGHEARAVREAGESLAREARRPVAQAPTRIGGHSVKVTPGGRLVRCTVCGIIREEYAVELARNPDLARRWFEIEELAQTAARTGDAAGAQRAANQASALADELEAFRRTREVRVYRGLRPGAVDDLFLMDRRLVVDMPFVGRGAADTNAAGWLRNASHYWDELARRHPEAFSPDNLRRIRGDPPLARPVAPTNDPQFRSVFTQYDVRGLRGEPLIHHHVAGGGQAAAIPAPLHPGSGGVHNVERAAGIWGAEDPIADVLQRLLQGTGATTP